jgi:hypothetical protein
VQLEQLKAPGVLQGGFDSAVVGDDQAESNVLLTGPGKRL